MTRPRVLLCPDTPNWAYDNICDQIVRHHGDTYEFERYYMAGSVGYPHVFLNQVFDIMGRFDIIHFFWREDVQHLLNPETIYKAATSFRLRPEDLFDAMSRPVITSSVYDHLFLEPEHFAWRERAFWYMDGYSVSSNLLDGIYRDTPVFPDPIAVLPDGIDLDRFQPRSLDRFACQDRPLRIGWVGNSQWGNDPKRDAKGLHSILVPALEVLEQEGLAIERHFADSTVRRRNKDEMVAYYDEIDLLVCSSEIEGTPNPVLEAMAMGVPVVSTRVGIVPDVLGPQQQAFILPERSVEAMTTALRQLVQDRGRLAALSEENLTAIRDWTWEKTTAGWPAFWDAALARHHDGQRGPLKRHLLQERYAAWYSENVRHKDSWKVASGPTRMKRSARMALVDWIYRTPRRAALINTLRGRR
ncbi:glycosyltransferase family 4 protein [Pseudooceanicola nanhaiensis]|uniref:glycosyltransferase family 4 protein n=1 Tax=Pseudooceanicola nanhaiensis TaxID=375761 RepID=UPI001CD52746|nr:glycosyltransferase family 4 protein [Pseudooceanicola nanhaiensis]MCA0918754.1 glycosyltransferase family 4 protein [Pseudooceanicola nanhaiensis]